MRLFRGMTYAGILAALWQGLPIQQDPYISVRVIQVLRHSTIGLIEPCRGPREQAIWH